MAPKRSSRRNPVNRPREKLSRWVGPLPEGLKPPAPGSAQERILDAALAVFSDKGFDATTTRDIAAEAGVNLASIHYHFGRKRDLYSRVLAREVVAFFGELARELAASSRSAAPLLLGLPRAIIKLIGAQPRRLALLRREFGGGAEVLQGVIDELGDWGPRGFRKQGLELIRAAQAAGEIRRGDPESILLHLLTHAYGLLLTGPAIHRVFGRRIGERRFLEQVLGEEERLLRRALLPARREGDSK